MSQFPLLQEVIEEASHIDLARAVTDCVAECRRRALLNKTYDQNVKSILNNINKNAAEAAETSTTPTLDKLRAKAKK